MGKYKKYHSDVKSTYVLGLQNELLPNKLKNQIPNSTSSYWKENEKSEHFVGGELASSIQYNLHDKKVFPDPQLDLILDCGTENNNATVADFIKSCEVSIQKKHLTRCYVFKLNS